MRRLVGWSSVGVEFWIGWLDARRKLTTERSHRGWAWSFVAQAQARYSPI